MPTQLPVTHHAAGRKSEGFCTPTEDRSPQKMKVPPRKVIPIVFLPGIMGSNLRLSAARQRFLYQSDNVAWQPDDLDRMLKMTVASLNRRQLTFDPLHTEVDVYDPATNPTGNRNQTADERHSFVASESIIQVEEHSPLLYDDPKCLRNPQSSVQKARARGWGEVFFESYGPILQLCETSLNGPALDGWNEIVDRDPSEWGAVTPLKPLTFSELVTTLSGTFFPVHAMGYNWLRSNAKSASDVAARIRKLISQYKTDGYQCEKVILVTHSMGGLVARALLHPDMGGLSHEVLGIVHGVMPASGAPATYKRMRSGFESGLVKKYVAAKMLGDTGAKVTVVLGNSPGGLELLPSKAYGNGWLQVRFAKSLFTHLPQQGDPYNEIYKISNSWFGLLRPEWLNPAHEKGASLGRTHQYLDDAKNFHDAIAPIYHPLSFAHYAVDEDMPSWESVCWTLSQGFPRVNWTKLAIENDDEQGKLSLISPDPSVPSQDRKGNAQLAPSSGKGDSTVPARSADHQLHSKLFQGVFRQKGYDHQESYKNKRAQNSTLFSIIRIAQQMKWSGDAD